jgi:multidrug efflux pump subunit AcrA (membrane-fusion protein)
MDIARPEEKKRKRIRRMLYAGTVLLLIVLSTAALSRLKPAAPIVDRSTVWTDTVKRGSMLRDVRGLGILVPRTIWVPAATDGHVDKRYVLPGTIVKADTIILDLSNPQLEQEALDAEYQLRGAQALLEQTKAQLQNQLMDKRTQAAVISSQFRIAELEYDADHAAFTRGAESALVVNKAKVSAEELAKENDLAEKEVETFANSIDAQLAVQQAEIDQKRALYKLYKSQMDEMHVRPGMDGMLQELDVDVGQRVTQGTVIAKVANQTQLKAALQIAETQAKDIQLGQKTSIDTHNGLISGHVMRIDPSVVNGTRTVEVQLEGTLPPGAVPRLSVEGTVEIERLADVLYVGRPLHGDPNSTVELFKLTRDGKDATRVQVGLGRGSVGAIEIRNGLQVGDQVILSDMSAWDNFDRVELR